MAALAFGARAVACPGDAVLLALCTVGAASGCIAFGAHLVSTFVGDTGSTLLGFLLAAAGLRCTSGVSRPTLCPATMVRAATAPRSGTRRR